MKLKILIFAFIAICFIKQTSASQIQTTESIKKAISLFVDSNLSSDADFKLTLGQFDNRLKLPFCKEPLDVFIRHTSLKPGRNSIGVKCNSPKKWSIYTPAIINLYKNVIVLSQPVRRGKMITDNMLKIEKREVSSLRSGFISDPMAIINKQATRNLSVGTVLNKSNYTEPKLIKRGDTVTIRIKSRNLNISMAGIAKMDGIKGQKIRVKNKKSKQIVQAIVEKQGQVVVTF